MMGGLMLSLKNEIVRIAPRGRINTIAPGWVRNTLTPARTYLITLFKVATPMAGNALKNEDIVYQALAS